MHSAHDVSPAHWNALVTDAFAKRFSVRRTEFVPYSALDRWLMLSLAGPTDLSTRSSWWKCATRARDAEPVASADGPTMGRIAEHIAHERRLVGAKRIRYSLNFARYYHRWYNGILLGLLSPDSSFSVLDCGCGTGVLLPALQERYRRAIGIDLCMENLFEARGVNGGSPLVVGDIGSLPVAPQSFHQIVCRGVLHRLSDVGLGLQQIFAALKDGGDLVIAEPIRDSRALNLLRVAALAAGTHPSPGGRVEYLTTREWIEAAHVVGFRTVQWFHLGYLAFPLLGFPEALSLMRYVPSRMTLAKILLRLDRVLARIPYVNTWSWQAVFHFRKPVDSVRRRAPFSGA